MSSRPRKDAFQVVAISPNMPGSAPAGMNGEFSRLTIMSSADTTNQPPSNDPSSVAFVKGGKRKRLSKACDACHKSKRRCDGTAPCSNCYFASKECTYTDASGRPVPAPRNTHPDRVAANASSESSRNLAITTGYQAEPTRPTANAAAATTGMRRQADLPDAAAKRARPEGLSPSSATGSLGSSPSIDSGHSSPASLLDPTTTHELINLFFAHCNPHRDITTRAPMPRLAGVPFFTEATQIMFDASGRLLSEPSLQTAQALCLLEMHEVAASHSWTKHYRYFDLALQILEEALEVHKPDNPAWATMPTVEDRRDITDRECVRRCFWLIQTMCWVNGIYTYRPMRPRSVELTRAVRLPVDETSFELAKCPADAEFIQTPGPRTKTASQFGHVCRVLSLYHSLETVIVTKDQQSRPAALAACRQSLEVWLASLPEHLRFSEENLERQIAMFETSANSGAWSYCFMHTLHPCYVLSIMEAEGRLQTEPIGWIRNQLNAIFKATGNRAKNTILSACTIWSYSKYYPNDPQIQEWDDSFEKLWGFRVTLVADQWRKTQSEQRSQIGRTYPVDSVAQHDSPPAFAVASSDSSPASQHASVSSQQQQQQSRSQTASTRSSPRDRHNVDPRLMTQPAGDGTAHGGSPVREQHQHHQHRASHPYIHETVGVGVGSGIPRDAVSGVPGGRPLQPQQSLPSLKSSGLLDSWKPPTEAFAQASISRGEERGAPAHHGHSQSMGRGTLPVGYNWLAEGQ